MTTTITRVARRATRTNNSCTPTNTEQHRTSRRVYLFDFFLALHGETIPVSHRAYTQPPHTQTLLGHIVLFVL